MILSRSLHVKGHIITHIKKFPANSTESHRRYGNKIIIHHNGSKITITNVITDAFSNLSRETIRVIIGSNTIILMK